VEGGLNVADPTVRTAETDDLGRIREIAESSLTSSYALSPNDIETIAEIEFDADALAERLDGDDESLLVAEIEDEDGDLLAGFATYGDGLIDWLHVDPERQGLGVGTALFERAREEADGSDDGVRAVSLTENTSSGRFFERFDFERVDERETEIGEQELREYVFAPADAVTETEDESERVSDAGESVVPTERDDLDLPDETEADGRTVYLGDEAIAGSEGGFVVTFADEAGTEEYGYYCVNCDSTDVSVGSMDQVKCGNCGNTHKPEQEYDGSYL